MNTVIEKIKEAKIVPVVVLNDSKDAIPLAESLVEGGLPIAEITFRTDAAEESIKIMSEQFPEILVGAGSLTSVETAKKAVDAGAVFLVSAGFHEGIANYSKENEIPYFPGICTPTELMKVVEYNIPIAKFFPAASYGGVKTIKAIAAAFPNMKFMPTGGINLDNVLEYLSFDKIVACGGSWMVKSDLISGQKFAKITELTKEAVELVSRL